MSISRSPLVKRLLNPQKKSVLQSTVRSRRGGSVLVIVACSMVMLMGFAAISVDYGILVSDANHMQRACDAAALGGASELYKSGTTAAHMSYDQDKARALAVSIAAKNGVVIDPNNVSFPANNKIRVVATRQRRMFFAAAIGVPNGSVTRSATAGRIALKGVPKAVPLAMTTDDYYAHLGGEKETYTLIRNHDTNFAPGTVASLDLRDAQQGRSGDVFQEDLTTGYDGTIHLGQDINNALNSSLSSQSQKLDRAMDARIARAALPPYNDPMVNTESGSNYTHPNYPAGNPRIMLLIVAPPNLASNNNPTLNAQFFVPVYLVKKSAAGQSETLTFRILPTLTYNSQDPKIVLDTDSASISGPSVVSLLN